MGLKFKIFPFNFNCNMNFSRNGNKRSSIESKNKAIAFIKYQELLNVISILVFGVLMQKIKM
jgi:hypothetical protein